MSKITKTITPRNAREIAAKMMLDAPNVRRRLMRELLANGDDIAAGRKKLLRKLDATVQIRAELFEQFGETWSDHVVGGRISIELDEDTIDALIGE